MWVTITKATLEMLLETFGDGDAAVPDELTIPGELADDPPEDDSMLQADYH